MATPTSGATRASVGVGQAQAMRAAVGRTQRGAPARAGVRNGDGLGGKSANGGRGRQQPEKGGGQMQGKKPLPLMLVVVALLTIIPIGLGSYVVFGPDTMWKPVYVRVEMDDPTPAAEAAEPAPAAPPAAADTHAPLPQATLPQPTQAVLAPTVPAPMYAGPGVMYQLGTKVVNLADPGGLRYLQTSIVLEFHPSVEQYLLALDQTQDPAEGGHDEGGGGLTSAIDARRPVIDDSVMTTLSSKRFNEISTVKGKQSLKEELIAAINQALGVPGVINIYFTEFVIQ